MYYKLGGLSLRAMTAVAVLCFQEYCRKYEIEHKDISDFNSQMLALLDAKDLPEWDDSFDEFEITGMEEALPEDLVSAYPEYAPTIQKITDHLREITASQMYAAYNPSDAQKHLGEVVFLCEVNVGRLLDISIFHEHDPGSDGWGEILDEKLIERWVNQA